MATATGTKHAPEGPRGPRRCLEGLSHRVNDGLAGFYENLGERVARHPWRAIGIVLTVTAALGGGWARLEVETRDDKLYTPQESRAMDDRAFVDARFGSTPRFVQGYYVTDANFLSSRDGVRDLFRFWRQVETDVADGALEDLCLRAGNGECSKQSVLGFWAYDETAFEQDGDWVATLSQTDVEDLFSVSETLVAENVMGGVERDASGRLTRVRAFRIEWVIADDGPDGFEEAFDAFTYDFEETTDGEFHPSTLWAFDGAIAAAFASDGQLTAVAYIVLTIYACLVLSSRNRVHSRSVLGLVAVLTVGCSVVSGFGFCIAIGIPFSLVVNSVIFVMLGLGVDDAFVILECLEQVDDPGLSIPKRLGRALARAGASITLTSVTDFAAFLSGSSTIIPALNNFCIFAAVTILFDFVYQVTFFVAFVKFDEDRIAAHRGDCCCCALCCVGCTSDPERVCCTKEKSTPESRRNTLVRRLITRWMPSVTLHPAGKAGVLLMAAAFIAAAGVGIDRLQLDFQYKWFVPDSSDVKTVLDIQDDYFSAFGEQLSFYTGDVDYFALQGRLQPFCDDIAANRFVDPLTLECWYASMEEDTGNAASNAADAPAFYDAINAYLQTTEGERFERVLRWNEDRSKLLATRFPLLLLDTANTQVDIDMMASVREVADDYDDLEAVVFNYGFVFFEGLAVMYEETVRNVIIALAVVFGVTLIFLADLRAAALVLINIALVDVCLLGFIHWWGMHMNMVIAINLLLAIGLTVDYSAHIAHAYMHSFGTRDERAQKALDHIGVSVFNGAITTLVATLPLAFAQTYVFQVFFKCFVMIVGFGLLFGIVVLPVILSLVGPSVSYAKEEPGKAAPPGKAASVPSEYERVAHSERTAPAGSGQAERVGDDEKQDS